MRGDDVTRSGGVPARAGAARRRRRRLAGRALGAAAVTVAGACWFLWPPDPQESTDPHVRRPGVLRPICASADGRTLYADVDGDGLVDEVRDGEEREGRTAVAFAEAGGEEAAAGAGGVDGAAAGPGGRPAREVSSIVATEDERDEAHAPPEEGFRAAFGDFDSDGRVDMAVTYSARDLSDTPVESMTLHEVRWGPLGRDLRGSSRGTIRIRRGYHVDGLRAVSGGQDTDRAARLLVHQTVGDGGWETYQGLALDGDLVVPDEPLPGWGQDFADRKGGWTDLGPCREERTPGGSTPSTPPTPPASTAP